MQPNRQNRRQFLTQASIGAATAVSVGASLSSRPLHASRQKKLKLAFIGVGGRGGANLNTIAQDPDVEVIGLCDVDRRKLEAAQKKFPDARSFIDFRVLYEQLNEADGVVVSTAEHTHAFATMPALNRGMAVYCEKPLTYNVAEARAITQAADAAGVATQMGTQLHASSNYRRVVELIQSGAIGEVSEVHVWVGRAWGLQSREEADAHNDIVYVTERPTETMEPPDYLDWDLWLGPAPYRPFHSVYVPGPKWYRWWDFANGTMSDLGSHWNDLPYWALELDAPLSIEASGPPPHPEIAPASMSTAYQYGPRGDLPACNLTWYQGAEKPPQWREKKIPQWPSGALFIGESGMLLADYRQHVLLPEEKYADFQPPGPFIPESPGHHAEWLAACRTGSPTGSPFSYAGPLTEANHLGNVAYRVGQKIQWDADAMQVANTDAAQPFLEREPREGWSL